MLGEILQNLTNATTAEAMLDIVGHPDIRARIEQQAAADKVPLGALVASKVRHLLDHGAEDVWLDLIGAMSRADNPGLAAVDRVLARAFPDPVRVRVTRGKEHDAPAADA